MKSRMPNPAVVLPEAMKSLQSLDAALRATGLSDRIFGLVQLRASQINGCSVCVDMHPRFMKKSGESDERIIAVSAWRDTPYFTDAERAALALTESLTRIADRADGVPDDVWDAARAAFEGPQLAALVLAIAEINVWNRLNVATRQMVGEQKWG